MQRTLRLRQLRAARAGTGLSQIAVSLKADIKHYRYWRIENGYSTPTPEEVARLERVLETSLADVFPAEVAR